MNELYYKDFIGFLKDEKVYWNYMSNFIKYNKVNSLSQIKFDCDAELLYSAFDWSSTIEGVFFFGKK